MTQKEPDISCNGDKEDEGSSSNDVQLQLQPNGTTNVGSFGERHRSEIVRVMLQTLQTLGYKESLQKLEDESGVLLQSQHINQFRACILGGEWDKVIELLPKLQIGENAVRHVKFLIYQQKFLELLEAGERKQAVECVRTQLTPVAHDTASLHKLTGLVMCKDMNVLYKRSQWDGKDGASRQLLIQALHSYISSDQLLQESRLFHLLRQAQLYQIQNCMYHNTTITDFSLLQDHTCSRSCVPQYTRTVLRNHSDEVWFVAFSHSGKHLATAGKDQRCFIFDASRWADPDYKSSEAPLLQCLEGHLDAVSFLAWSPDDSLLVTCSQDCSCRVWSVQTGECVLKFTRHSEPVTAAAWYPDGHHVVSAAQDKYVYKWDLTGKVKGKHCGARVNDITVSRDSTRMVTIDSDKKIINYNLQHPLDKLPEHEPTRGYINDARERHDDSDDGGAESGDDDDHPSSRMSETYKIIHKANDSLTSLNLSVDGHYILVNKSISEKRGCIHLYDIRHRPFKVTQKYAGHLQKRFVIRSCFGGANQIFVLSGSEDHKVYVYHRDTGRKLFALTGHTNVVNTVAWNPCIHNMFASGSDDGTVRVWTTHPTAQPEDEDDVATA
uniref:CTLH domain-containing protein n=1 Tax=Eutreptiella gymnastica TaxID=73025 RepID=A0A7S4GNX4_9EUGL|mmetsp:Transcript_87403/g.145264  ORF Transcript_87403/g.145264 Transcript_87403/m.145264 type:complete len:609 (+) Transcript_87403:133-1959(+)